MRTICPDCRAEEAIDAAERERLGVPDSVVRVYEGRGCAGCLGSGYRGRTVIAETLPVTGEIEELIAAGAPVSKLRECAGRMGLPDILDDGMSKVAAGVVTVNEIRRVLG